MLNVDVLLLLKNVNSTLIPSVPLLCRVDTAEVAVEAEAAATTMAVDETTTGTEHVHAVMEASRQLTHKSSLRAMVVRIHVLLSTLIFKTLVTGSRFVNFGKILSNFYFICVVSKSHRCFGFSFWYDGQSYLLLNEVAQNFHE